MPKRQEEGFGEFEVAMERGDEHEAVLSHELRELFRGASTLDQINEIDTPPRQNFHETLTSLEY